MGDFPALAGRHALRARPITVDECEFFPLKISEVFVLLADLPRNKEL